MTIRYFTLVSKEGSNLSVSRGPVKPAFAVPDSHLCAPISVQLRLRRRLVPVRPRRDVLQLRLEEVAGLKETGRSWEMRRGMTHRETRPERIKCYRNDITTRMAETQVLFRIERELLEALDKVLSLEGFRTRNEWFRAQIRKALGEASRKRLAGVLDRLSVEGIREEDIAEMVREWRSKKGRR